MTLKKEIGFDLAITIILWVIYTGFTDRDPISLGLSSFLFGAPYCLATLKNFLMNPNDSEFWPHLIFFIYSGIILSCAFFLMLGRYDSIFIGLGSVKQIHVSHNTFFTFFLSLGAYPVTKLF